MALIQRDAWWNYPILNLIREKLDELRGPQEEEEPPEESQPTYPPKDKSAVYRGWYYWCDPEGQSSCYWRWWISCPNGQWLTGAFESEASAKENIDAMIDWEQIKC